jgi:fructose-bisphosphate aldolase/2-amino-3,7-dideoxy-D-threo-hept-6-ulosonate synthase
MTGSEIRLARLMGEDGRCVVVALDHAQFSGALPGLTPMSKIVTEVVEGGADGVILNPGAARHCVGSYAGRCGLIVRITGASTERNPSFDYHRRICSVEGAVALGADAVIAMGFVGGPGEAASLSLLSEIVEECIRLGMPLIAEMLPAEREHFYQPDWIGLAARVGAELGADIIKAYTTGTPADADVIHGCAVPFLAAGGPRSDNPREIAARAMANGAAGIAFGRNVFGAGEPRRIVEELVDEVHGRGRGGGSRR